MYCMFSRGTSSRLAGDWVGEDICSSWWRSFPGAAGAQGQPERAGNVLHGTRRCRGAWGADTQPGFGSQGRSLAQSSRRDSSFSESWKPLKTAEIEVEGQIHAARTQWKEVNLFQSLLFYFLSPLV